jgi:hypothetical protein
MSPTQPGAYGTLLELITISKNVLITLASSSCESRDHQQVNTTNHVHLAMKPNLVVATYLLHPLFKMPLNKKNMRKKNIRKKNKTIKMSYQHRYLLSSITKKLNTPSTEAS